MQFLFLAIYVTFVWAKVAITSRTTRIVSSTYYTAFKFVFHCKL